MSNVTILNGDCRDVLAGLPDKSAHCCVTSPPYFGLRDYGIGGQIGLEQSPQEYVGELVKVFREVRRVLRDDGTLWLNLGDSYAAQRGGTCMPAETLAGGTGGKGDENAHRGRVTGGVPKDFEKNRHSNYMPHRNASSIGLKHKDLVGIPWRVAFALQADGWYLRQDIIWCLSGGTWLYARTQKGDMPIMVKDLHRLNPATVKLWNGEKWTQLLGMNKNKRSGNELEIVLRSGERVSCTPTHKFPTARGLVEAGDLRTGDILASCVLPEPEQPRDCAIDEDAAWFAGLFLAEGSRSEDTIQLSGHARESDRWDRVQRISGKFGGYATLSTTGNNQSIRVYGKIPNAIVNELVTGKTAKDKGFAPVVWRYSNRFLSAMVDGYLSGDGHRDGDRWRLGFCRNYNLERDLRTACARLGYTLTLNTSASRCNGVVYPSFRGELRKTRTGHHNEHDRNEVVAIRKARCRFVYDMGVADDPHVFAMASGVLTHNSKPNPMPESVRDRCTKAHEYIFLMSKSERYYFDSDAIRNPPSEALLKQVSEGYNGKDTKDFAAAGAQSASGTKSRIIENARKKIERVRGHERTHEGFAGKWDQMTKQEQMLLGSNKRSVWTVATRPYKGAHFATFPPDLIEPCILAGCPSGGTVLDPFGGSGTTGMVAKRAGRDAILVELNPDYAGMAEGRCA